MNIQNAEDSYLVRFHQLLEMAEEVKKRSGLVRNEKYGPFPYADTKMIEQWMDKSLDLILDVFGKDKSYYIRFKKHHSDLLDESSKHGAVFGRCRPILIEAAKAYEEKLKRDNRRRQSEANLNMNSYPLTNKQKELLVWLVHHTRQDNLGEEFSALVGDDAIKSFFPSKKGLLDELPNGITRSTFETLGHMDFLTYKNIRGGFTCTMLGSAYEAVDRNFDAFGERSSSQLPSEKRAVWKDAIVNFFSKEEITEMMFEFGESKDNVPDTQTHSPGLAIHLIKYAEKHDRLDELKELLLKKRPTLHGDL